MTGAVRAHVVVVTHQSRRHFPALKAALEAQTERDFALTVWDNASTPDQRPTQQDLPRGARIVLSPDNLGFAAGNNRAVETGPPSSFVALLNPDAFPEPDWLRRLLAAAERWPQAAAFGSTQLAAEDETRFDGVGDCYFVAGIPWRAAYGHPRSEPYPTGEVFSPCAAAALYRRDVWDAAGGFDERLFCFGEDVDLGFRLRLMGQACIQVGDAVVRHVGGASTGRRSAFADRFGVRNRLWVFFKNMPSPWVWLLAPAHFVLTALLLASYPLSGRGYAGWKGFAEGWAGLGATLKQRGEVQRQRRASVGQLLAAMAWSPMAMLRRAPVLRPISSGPSP